MKMHHLTIAILTISLFFLGATTYLSDLGDSYGATIDYSGINITEETLNQQSNLTAKLTKQVQDFSSEDNSGTGVLAIPYRFLTLVVTGIRLIFNSFGVVGAMITDIGRGISSALGLPVDFLGGLTSTIISIFTITLVAIMFYAFFKWKFED